MQAEAEWLESGYSGGAGGTNLLVASDHDTIVVVEGLANTIKFEVLRFVDLIFSQ
jgi:hypothetical protein